MGLKGIPAIISPELLKALAEMGHGDTIVLADAHFPGHSIGRKNGHTQVIRADGVKSIADLMTAILTLIDLDSHDSSCVKVMDLTDGDKKKGVLKAPLPVWQQYVEIANKSMDVSLTCVERFDFYKKSSEASVIVITSDTALYGNVMLTKGVLPVS